LLSDATSKDEQIEELLHGRNPLLVMAYTVCYWWTSLSRWKT